MSVSLFPIDSSCAPPGITTHRGEGRPARARGFQAGGGRPDAAERLGVGESIGIPSLRASQVIRIRSILQRRVQAFQATGVVASHRVLVQVHGHGAVRVELSRRLAMERLLMTLRARRTCSGVVVIHIRRLLITHGGRRNEKFPPGDFNRRMWAR